jgi:hypothetical protein
MTTSIRTDVVLSNISLDAQLDETNTSASTDAPAASMLPDPIGELLNSGDPGAMVAALVAKSGQAQRAVRDQVRRSEDATQDAAEKSQVAHMHEQADLTRTGAIVSGLTSIASGALSAGAAGASAQSDQLKASGSAMGAKHMSGASTTMGGMHTGLDIAGKAAGSFFEAAGKDIAAKATEDEHHAARAARNVKNADEGIDDANRLIDKALAFYKEYTSGKNQAVQAATHRA